MGDFQDSQLGRQIESWPILNAPEKAREAVQLRLITRWLNRFIPNSGSSGFSPRLLRKFLQICDLATIFQKIMTEDSILRTGQSLQHIPFKSGETLHEIFLTMNRPTPVADIPGMDSIPRIWSYLHNIPTRDFDESSIISLDAAFEQLWHQQELEDRCLTELQLAENAIQRAKLYLEIDQVPDAFREYMRISPDEAKNPENTLDLVDLIEHFGDKSHALQTLKRWMIFEITLHPLSFDLLADIFLARDRVTGNARVRYLRSTLRIAPDISLEDMQHNMQLTIPSRSTFIIDVNTVEKRMKHFNISLKDLDIYIDDEEPLTLHHHLADINNQLNHMADLAVDLEQSKTALILLERSILFSFVRMFLPPRNEDIQQIFGYGEYDAGLGLIMDDLKDLAAIQESITPARLAEKRIFDRLTIQISTVRKLLGEIARKRFRESSGN